MLAFHPLHINLVNLMVLTHTWKSEVPDIYDMRYTMQPNMSATGIQRLLNTLQRNEQKASITMLLCLTPQRSSFACSTILKLRAKSTFHKLSLEPELTNTYCTSRRLDKPKHTDATIFQNEGAFRLCCLALSVALAVFSQHLYAVCQGRRIFLTFFILSIDFL